MPDRVHPLVFLALGIIAAMFAIDAGQIASRQTFAVGMSLAAGLCMISAAIAGRSRSGGSGTR